METEAAKPAAEAAAGKERVPTVGILLVHGIGEQRRGDTLVRCGEPLYGWIRSWLEGAAVVRNTTADVSIADTALLEGDEPAHIRVRARVDGAEPLELRWLVAEAWWADSFPPPGATAVIGWLLFFGPRLLRGYFGRTYKGADALLGLEAAPEGVTEHVLLWWWQSGPALPLMVAMKVGAAAALVVSTVLLWVLLLSLLPLSIIPPLRRAIRWLQLRLSNSVGDSYTLLHSPIRFGAMVAKMQRDVRWLEKRCDEIAVVAHSQGSVVAFTALRELDVNPVRLFITYGSALRILTKADLTLPCLGAGLEWHDFFANADPVPGGPLWAQVGSGRSTTAIDNLCSVFSDHSSYWQNPEQFVSVVAQRLALLGGVDLRRLTPRDEEVLIEAERRRKMRVAWLLIARWTVIVGAFFLLALVGSGRLEKIGGHAAWPLRAVVEASSKTVLASVDDLWNPPIVRWIVGALVVCLSLALFYRLGPYLIWSGWHEATVQRTTRRADLSCPGRQAAFLTAAALLPLGVPIANVVLHFTRHEAFSAGYLFLLGSLASFWGAYGDYLRSKDPLPLTPADIAVGEDYALREEMYVPGKVPRCARVRVLETNIPVPVFTGYTYPMRTIPRGIRVEVVEEVPRRRRWDAPARYRVGKTIELSGTRRLYARWEDYMARRDRPA